MRLYQCTVYAYYFYNLISILIITSIDVHKKLNNHILQCYDLKCTHKIKPLRMDYYILKSSKYSFQSDIKF